MFVFVRHGFWTIKFVDAASPLSRWNLETVLTSLAIGDSLCRCASAFNFGSAPLEDAITECWSWKQSNLGIFASQGQLSIWIKVKFDEEQHFLTSNFTVVHMWAPNIPKLGQTCDFCASRWHSERRNFAEKIIAQVQLCVPHFAPLGEGVWWAYIYEAPKIQNLGCAHIVSVLQRLSDSGSTHFSRGEANRSDRKLAPLRHLVNWFIEWMTRKPSLEVAPTSLATVFLL